MKDYVSSQDTKLLTIQVDSGFKWSEANRSLTKESIRHTFTEMTGETLRAT